MNPITSGLKLISYLVTLMKEEKFVDMGTMIGLLVVTSILIDHFHRMP